MSTLTTVVAPVIFVITLIVIDVLCGNVWQKPVTQQNQPLPPKWGQNATTTTPWPALGQRPNSGPSQNMPNNPKWVRPTSPPHQRYNEPFAPANNPNNRMPSINRAGGPNSPSAGFRLEENGNRQGGNVGSTNNNPNAASNSQVEDYELREFSETLLNKDTNNAARHTTVNYQGMTTSRSEVDEAPLPLLSVSQEALRIPSIEKMMLLYNNYILESNQNEHYTGQEKIEENDLLDTILSTSVMQHTRNFLIQKGRIGRDPKEFKDILREIWFNMYSRGGGRIGSSGFEHIFLAEIKNNQVSGLHNWLYFNEEEKKNEANYLGYMKKIDLGNKGAILKYHFKFHGIDKPVGSMFIGTSPELEIALYSTCFLLRADRVCPLKLNGNRFIIRTYTYRYRGKNMIGSAFPEI